MQIDRFKGNTYDISKMETKLEQARSSAIAVASKAMPDKFEKLLESMGIKKKKSSSSTKRKRDREKGKEGQTIQTGGRGSQGY